MEVSGKPLIWWKSIFLSDTFDSAVVMFGLVLDTKNIWLGSGAEILFWLKIPGFVVTNTTKNCPEVSLKISTGFVITIIVYRSVSWKYKTVVSTLNSGHGLGSLDDCDSTTIPIWDQQDMKHCRNVNMVHLIHTETLLSTSYPGDWTPVHLVYLSFLGFIVFHCVLLSAITRLQQIHCTSLRIIPPKSQSYTFTGYHVKL